MSRSVDAVYVFGGDGTYNEVLNGIRSDVPLGLPGGAGRAAARARPAARPGKAALQVAQGRTRRIGLGRVNGRRFGFSAGIGFDAELVRRVDESSAAGPTGGVPATGAFLRAALGALAGPRPLRASARARGPRPSRALALVANCSLYTYAGAIELDLGPGASFDEGLAVVAPVRLRARNLPRLLLRGARGHGVKPGDALAARDLDRLVVRCDRPLALQVDGEDTGDVVEAVYEADRMRSPSSLRRARARPYNPPDDRVLPPKETCAA